MSFIIIYLDPFRALPYGYRNILIFLVVFSVGVLFTWYGAKAGSLNAAIVLRACLVAEMFI